MDESQPKPKAWRKANVAVLAILYAVLSAQAFLMVPRLADTFGAVNIPLPAVAEFGLRIVSLFRSAWLVFGIGFGSLGFLGWLGALDKLIKPLTLFVLLLCLAAAAMAVYIHFLPDIVTQDAKGRGIDLFRRK